MLFRALILTTLLVPSGLLAQCRQALVLALDISGSVDAQEYALQVNGLADALDSPPVRQLILASPAHVALSAYEWSAPDAQALLLPWTELKTHADIDAAITRIRAPHTRLAAKQTAIGRALQYGLGLLDNGPSCWHKTIDISGDGKNNAGPTPPDVKRHPGFSDVTINALVVRHPSYTLAAELRDKSKDLDRYFRRDVIHGAGSFVMQAEGYADYARAMQAKLERELSFGLMSAWTPSK